MSGMENEKSVLSAAPDLKAENFKASPQKLCFDVCMFSIYYVLQDFFSLIPVFVILMSGYK